MVDKIKRYINNLMNNLTPGNKVILVVFLIALVYMIFASIAYEIGSIGKEEQHVNFYSENIDEYSFDVEGEYQLTQIKSYDLFYSTELNLKEIVKNMSDGNFDKVYKIMSKSYIKKLGLSKDEITSKLQKFYVDNFAGMGSINLKDLYRIPDSNYYIAVFVNKNGDDVRIAFNLDNTTYTYTLEYLDF